MNFFHSVANLIPEFKELKEFKELNSPGTVVSGLSRIHKAHFVSQLRASSPLLVLVETENEAMRMCEDIQTFAGSETVAAVFPARDWGFVSADAQSAEYEHRRIAVLSGLISNAAGGGHAAAGTVVVSTPEAAAQVTISPQELTQRIITIEKDSELNVDELLSSLVSCGYTRVDMVEAVSQFSVRGSVIDVFPVNSAVPVRFDLWGDTVESAALFDVGSQRRSTKVDIVHIAPATENLEDSGESNKCLFDFVHNVIVCEQTACDVQLNAAYEQMKADLELAAESGVAVGKCMVSKSEYDSHVSGKLLAEFSTFSRSAAALSVSAIQVPPWSGDYKQLKDDLQQFMKSGYAVVMFAGTEKSAKSLALDLREDGIKADYSEFPKKVFAKHIFVTAGTLSAGFDYPAAKCACLTHLGRTAVSAGGGVNAAKPRLPTAARRKSKAETIRMITDMNVGDYIVHDNHGIGVFEGVTKLTADGASKDYIKLRYAGKDVLYVPVTQLDFIARYIGNTDSASLKLSKLHTDSWFKTKAKVKKAVEELAEELIELYSKRMRAAGYKFKADDQAQLDFENAFGYIETDDQLTCIEELKGDMQSERPMDRLLCGDVGFGKTEVALRGVFKCVMNGKQCALLCPTTVLAWQHYQTALQRMSGLGDMKVNIELLSRFRSAKEQREIRAKLKSGVVDFVIGTHTLVGKTAPVEFNNLGLVIIDEEQRFGVAQKERLKEAFTGVDVLTLSATPIPRTLNMAMSGIRDMSVIETPPHDRIPVTTYVIEHEFGVVAQAINKELRRAGQVYYIHNRVESIMTCAAKLHELVPEARIGIAHGRMDERELLDVWRKLLEREIDVLVCTTLIETGVDVPNVNTLIIENADRMGLAQLHQLRGRVGRTNKRAFAYFTFQRGKVLSEIAEKRLKAVREFTQFGAGFKIALRDLEIRGAGSVLGESQSGHLSAVGYEMYVNMLEQAVAEIQGDDGSGAVRPASSDVPAVTAAVVDIKSDAFIPEGYIGNQSQRIACYKKIAEIRDEADAVDVVDELTDRYGVLPKSVRGLVEAARLRNMASRLGIAEIVHVPGKQVLVLYWEEPDMKRISQVSERFAKRVGLELAGRVNVTLKLGEVMWNEKGRWKKLEPIDDVLGAAIEFLGMLSKS
jgi:transcription-repair coupling factor (superfamily II helicase)